MKTIILITLSLLIVMACFSSCSDSKRDVLWRARAIGHYIGKQVIYPEIQLIEEDSAYRAFDTIQDGQAEFVLLGRADNSHIGYDYGIDVWQDSCKNIIYNVYDANGLIGHVKANQLDSLIEMDNQ